MKDLEQLKEDAKKDPELEKELIEAEREFRETSDKAAFIRKADGLGYTISDDVFNQAKVALNDDELADVAGGGKDAPDGHEIGCILFWYRRYCEVRKGECRLKFVSEGIQYEFYRCIYCGKEFSFYKVSSGGGHAD